MKPSDILLLPGWQNSGPGHWQTAWAERRGCTRVEQHDWQRPLRGDWTAQLQEAVLLRPGPVVLAAHSLGCLLAAWWAAHSPEAPRRVAAALLVAPPEIERDDLRQAIPGWSPPARQRLPFPALVVASTDDAYGSAAYARQLARDWGAAFHSVGPCGHVNAASGLGDWDEGWRLLLDLMQRSP